MNKRMDMDDENITPSEEKRQLAKIQAQHLRALSDACLRAGIPSPMAAMHSRKASALLKSLSMEDTDKTPRCYQCALNFMQPNSFVMHVSRVKPPSTKLIKRLRKLDDKRQLNGALKRLERSRRASLIAICKGCGAQMRCARLQSLNKNNLCNADKSDESLYWLINDASSKRISSTLNQSSNQIGSAFSTPRNSNVSFASNSKFRTIATSKSLCSLTGSSSVRRRKAASRLQAVLSAEDAKTTIKSNSLSAFLDSLKA